MVNGVARLVKVCRNRSGLDELMVILDGTTMTVRQSVRVAGVLSLQLMYCFVHFLHSFKFLDLQFKLSLIRCSSLVAGESIFSLAFL